MTTGTDVVIIGGGIVGLTIALAAAERGLSVVVIDAPATGAASRAAAGMLAPSLEGMPPHVLPHALAARDFYPAFLGDLHERTGLDVELNRSGILELAEREEELAVLCARALPGASVVSPRDLASLEPALAPHAGAILHPHDGAVDNVALMKALEQATHAHSRIRRVADRVQSVQAASPPRVTLVSGTQLASHWVVVAAGAWAPAVDGLPSELPVVPVRGQLLTLTPQPLRHVMYAPRTGYLVPRGGQLVVGATIEHTGFVTETTAWGRQELLAVVARTLPGLTDATVTDHWAGLRPMTPDTLPIVGPDPAAPCVVYAAGFSRNGILLAPWMAARMAELLATERAPASLDSFSVARFARQ